MADQKYMINTGKQHLVFLAILGPTLALILGVILGIQVTKEPAEVGPNQSTQALLDEVIPLSVKKYKNMDSGYFSKSNNALVKEITDLWRMELDKVDFLPLNSYDDVKHHIVGYLFGNHEKDRYIVFGSTQRFENSGISVIMALVKSFGRLKKSNKWQPSRTIVFCSFAYELGKDDATWVSAVEKNLLSRAVIYFDLNNVIEGNVFVGSGSPSVKQSVLEIARLVENPDIDEVSFGRPYVYDTWLHNSGDEGQAKLPSFEIQSLRNENQILLHKAGVPYVCFGYKSSGRAVATPVASETRDFSQTLTDPDGRFSVALAQMYVRLAMKFSNELIFPFSPSDYFRYVYEMVSAFLEQYTPALERNGINVKHIHNVLKKFGTAVSELATVIENVDKNDISRVRILNDKLANFDRMFLDMTTLYSGSHSHHILFGVRDSNCPQCHHLPRLRSAVLNAELTGNWNEVAKQLSALTFFVDSAAEVLSDFN